MTSRDKTLTEMESDLLKEIIQARAEGTPVDSFRLAEQLLAFMKWVRRTEQADIEMNKEYRDEIHDLAEELHGKEAYRRARFAISDRAHS
jgi:hypothetical protein